MLQNYLEDVWTIATTIGHKSNKNGANQQIQNKIQKKQPQLAINQMKGTNMLEENNLENADQEFVNKFWL